MYFGSYVLEKLLSRRNSKYSETKVWNFVNPVVIFEINAVIPRKVCCELLWLLSLSALIPENGQTHSNNLSTKANELFECFWPFCGVSA